MGDLGADAQAKLLRAIEASEIERVGGGKPIKVDVRIIAATNMDLARGVAEGRFREDLFHRLNVIPMTLPPLRERPDDVKPLVLHFSALFRSRAGRPAPRWSDAALALMTRHRWPGNVRELANTVERLAILHEGAEVSAADVAAVLPAARDGAEAGAAPAMPEAAIERPLNDALDDFERALITHALHAAKGNVADAARRLKTDRPNLYRRMRRLGIRVGERVSILRRAPLAIAAAAMLAGGARAQGAAPDTSHTLPWDVAGEVAYRYNLPAAVRARGNTTIAAGRVVDGNVAVRDGSLVVEGTVHGSVIVINGSLDLRAGSRVDSEAVVVGGVFKRADSAQIGGKVSVYPQMLTYRVEGDAIVAVHDSVSTEGSWFKRWQTRYDSAGTRFALRAGTYDRVEGLPVEVGLDLRRNLSVGRFSLLRWDLPVGEQLRVDEREPRLRRDRRDQGRTRARHRVRNAIL